jgi:hypothetical protein
MTAEKVTLEQAIQKLSEANNTNNTRLTDLEQKITEIYLNITGKNKDESNITSNEITNLQNMMANQIETIQTQGREWQDTTIAKLEQNQQQWNHLTSDVRDMKTEISKICEALLMNQTTKNNDNQPIETKTCTPHTNHNSSTTDESFDLSRPVQHAETQHIHRAEQNSNYSIPTEGTSQTTHTIVIPPTSCIPTFQGIISENPRQFLIRMKEYAETINHWNEQSLLNGLSQFLRGTALEWYCQLRTSHRHPQTWTEFVTVFLNQFNSPMRRARHEQLWKNCKQEENETINEFIVRLRTLWREQKPNETEEDLIRHLMRKMKNSLWTMIGTCRYETLDDIIFEAQKVEEALYQRAKQQQQYNNKQESPHYNSTSTSLYDEDEQCEVQAMSAQRSKQRSNSYMEKPRYTNYSSQTTTYRRNFQPTYNLKCYTCGLKGHTTNQCPSQYNVLQQQYSRRYPKNGNGAQAGRDHGAPM